MTGHSIHRWRNRVRLPTALRRWAAEHNQSLSGNTRSEVDLIAAIIDASSLRNRSIFETDPRLRQELDELFPPARAANAEQLAEVVAKWAATLPEESATIAQVSSAPQMVTAAPEPQPATPSGSVPSASGLRSPGSDASAEVGPGVAPAFLRSDKVDEDDTDRLYGKAGSYVRVVLAVLSVLLLAALGVGVWFWASTRSDDSTADQLDDQTALTTDASDADTEPIATVAPTPAPTTESDVINQTSAWADTTTILNAGDATILASTYAVNPANRAVLTGHTAAITGVAITDVGRVFTSGADMRLVDWGTDVTVTSPDVLDLESPLTALMRTADQRLVAGDANGNLIILSLTETAEPIVIAVHGSAISSVIELTNGSIAASSVDGAVQILSLDAPGTGVAAPHTVEVTAMAALANGTLATAAVDGVVRIWPTTGGAPQQTITTVGAPITSLVRLSDERLAVGTLTGSIQILDPASDGAVSQTIAAHDGAVRALIEIEDNGITLLASGSDDSTIRLFRLTDGQLWQQLDGHGDFVSALDLLPDGRLLSTSGDGTGRVWDLSLAAGPIVEPPHRSNLSDIVAWRNDQFVTGGVDGRVMLASTSETTIPQLITQHGAPLVGVAIMSNGDIVSLDAASVLRLNQSGPGAAEAFEVQLPAGATALDNRGSDGIVTGHADGTVRTNDFTAETASIDAHQGGVTAVLGLSSGLVASAGEDGLVRVFDPASPDASSVFDLHSVPVTALAELPDGRIASAGTDGIYIWSTDDMGTENIRLNGHRERTISLLGLGDGRLLSTAADGRVRAWDLLNPDNQSTTLLDVPGVVNPVLAQAGNGLFVAGAGRGYVVFTID